MVSRRGRARCEGWRAGVERTGFSVNLIYRRILPSDMEAIFEVRVQTWHNENGAEEMARMGITHESVQQLMKVTRRGWLAEVDGEVVGFAMGDKSTGEMWVIAVLKEFEDQGIGRGLMALVEEWLFGKGWREIWLTTDADENYRAVGFYRRLGWEDWKMEDGDRFMRKAV